MQLRGAILSWLILSAIGGGGCRSAGDAFVSTPAPTSPAAPTNLEDPALAGNTRQAAFLDDPAGEPTVDEIERLPAPRRSAEEIPADIPTAELSEAAPTPTLIEVVQSVRNHFPLIREAAAGRIVASGEAISAVGAFDHKLDGYSNGQPLDFYENNWHKWSVKRDTMWGGQVGAQYRIGRGSFEPWYKERETNDGGELGLILSAPIWRDVTIDANRAELWRAQLERNRIEPVVRLQIIGASRAGAEAYWEWVAVAANLRIAQDVLQLGLDRVEFLDKEIKAGEKAEIDRVDNRRIIVSRRSKLIAAQQKLQQAAIKLSLYLRLETGQPRVLADESPDVSFPEIESAEELIAATDLEFALATRPELAELAIVRRQLAVAYRQAQNETKPDIDGGFFVGQDVGNPTKSDDKSDFELEAILTVTVPLERRKAVGKVRQLRGKLAQVRAKTQFAADKVTAEVRVARTALLAAAARVEQTRQGVELARRMQAAENRLFEEGDINSSLFSLNLREQQAAEAAAELVAAQLDLFLALADYTAAVGLDATEFDTRGAGR